MRGSNRGGEQALHLLGFQLKRAKCAADDRPEPDYYLRTPAGDLVAVCMAYCRGRFLDGKDEQRDAETPEENPGALVVSLLERGDAPLAIVTNGKHWRLYAAKTHSRATWASCARSWPRSASLRSSYSTLSLTSTA